MMPRRHRSRRVARHAATAAAIAAAVVLNPTAQPAASAELTMLPAARAPSGASAVSTRWLQVVDTRRWTVSHGHVLAHRRTLPTLVLAPTTPGEHPLVVFCHGYDITPYPYLHLLRHWAEAGFVVAAPYFPLTRPGAGRWLDENDVSHQPGDVSAVITRVLHVMSGVVDRRHIAVAGHSDGGSTAFAVGFDKKDTDPRVSAILAFSADRWGPASDFAAPTRKLSLLLVQSDRDELNPPWAAGVLWRIARRPKAFLHLHGARHLPPFAAASRWRPIVEAVSTDFLHAWSAPDAAARDRDLRALREDGSRRSLSQVEDMR